MTDHRSVIHATALAIRFLRGTNAGIFAIKLLGRRQRMACKMTTETRNRAFNRASAKLLLADQSGWEMPTCPKCRMMVVEALSIRTAEPKRPPVVDVLSEAIVTKHSPEGI